MKFLFLFDVWLKIYRIEYKFLMFFLQLAFFFHSVEDCWIVWVVFFGYSYNSLFIQGYI